MGFAKFKQINFFLIAMAAVAMARLAFAGEQHHAGHQDPFSEIVFTLIIVILVAMAGRYIAGFFHQTAVVGELLIGILLGNILYWCGSPVATLIMHLSETGQMYQAVWNQHISIPEAANIVFTAEELSHGVGKKILDVLMREQPAKYVLLTISLWIFSNLGIMLLLFMTGLETSVQQMLKVGPRAIMVATIGVVFPFALGYGITCCIFPELSHSVGLLVGATLCATSVGITARVLEDMGKMSLAESKLILGAAVIDDILGLVVLAVVTGIITTGHFQTGVVLQIIFMSILFISGIIFIGERLVRKLIHVVGKMDRPTLKILFPVTFAFGMAWLADKIGLAGIIGAFAAGVLLCDSEFKGETDESETVEELILPFRVIFAPIFFVLMGMQVNLMSFLNGTTLVIAGIFIVAAIFGKIISGIAAGRGMNKWAVGMGMIPRGEVGLIFASIGRGMGVFDDSFFAAIVLMVIVTTLITPAGLEWSFAKINKGNQHV